MFVYSQVLVFVLIAVMIYVSQGAALSRTPKVYNALITTDQNLTPSRAYPVIQPTIHESPFFYPPYGYSPLNFLDAWSGPWNSAGNTQGIFARYNNRDGIATVDTDRKYLGSGAKSDNSLIPHSSEKAPIPLNEWTGLPPSLIPLNSYNYINHKPIDLAPYNFNSYPLIYEQFGGYQPGPYLPHYGYVPQNSYATALNGITQSPSIESSTSTGSSATSGSNDLKVIGLDQNPTDGGASIAATSGSSVSQSLLASGSAGSTVTTTTTGSGGGGSSGSSSLTSSTSTASTGTDGGSTGSTVRIGRVFYFNDDIKNNKNRNPDIVDVPPPPLPFGAKSTSEEE